jgi:hypothetical protein
LQKPSDSKGFGGSRPTYARVDVLIC